jgi:hypothetical protein
MAALFLLRFIINNTLLRRFCQAFFVHRGGIDVISGRGGGNDGAPFSTLKSLDSDESYMVIVKN